MTGASFVRIASGNWSPHRSQPRAATRTCPRWVRLTPCRNRCRRPTRRSPTLRRRSNCGAQSGVRARPLSHWSPRLRSQSWQGCTRGNPRRDMRHRSWRVPTRQRRRRGPTSRAGQRHRNAGPRSPRATSATARATQEPGVGRRFAGAGLSAPATAVGGNATGIARSNPRFPRLLRATFRRTQRVCCAFDALREASAQCHPSPPR